MVIVCFINNLVDKHIIDVLNESRLTSRVKTSRSTNTSQAESFQSEKREFSFPLIEIENEDLRSRSLPHILGDPLVSDITASPNGPTFPAILEEPEFEKEQVVTKYNKKRAFFKAFDFKTIITDHTRLSASMKILVYAIMAFSITLILRMSYIQVSINNCVFDSIKPNKSLRRVSKLDILSHLIFNKSSKTLENFELLCAASHMRKDRLNVVVVPALLTMIDYTVCSEYPTSSKFLKNLTLLEVYHSLNSLDYNLKLKMFVWFIAHFAFVMNMKFNKFVLRTINGLDSYDIFRLFQVSLNNKLVYLRLVVFYSFYKIIPLGTLIPLILLMKMMMALTQIINLRFVKQKDPYCLFRITMTALVWTVSCVAFGQAKDYKSLLSLKYNLVYIFKRFCVLMACRYYATLVVDYQLTLIPVDAFLHENRLNMLNKPLYLFNPLLLNVLSGDINFKALLQNLYNGLKNKSIFLKNEVMISKSLFIETFENIRTSSKNEIVQDAVIDDFATVVYLTNKRLVKWTNNGYAAINNDSFQRFSWSFFINKFYGRSLEIDVLIEFDTEDENNDAAFLKKINPDDPLYKGNKLIVSGNKNKYCYVYPTSNDDETANLFLMDIVSGKFINILLEGYLISDIVDCYYFQEGQLGMDSANSLLVVTKSADIIEVDLYSYRITNKNLKMLKKIDNWKRLKTDRMAERSIIYDTHKKYIGQYVRFRGWKVMPFPMEQTNTYAMNNVIMKKGHSMNTMTSSTNQMMNKFKMFPMVQQTSDPTSLRSQPPGTTINNDKILKIETLEHLGFIYEVIENETENKHKWVIRLMNCVTGKTIKRYEINSKHVDINSITITHEKDLKFCGFCGFLSCKKLHLHYLVKNPNTKETTVNIIVLINLKVKNMKKQRICFRTERDARDIRCHGIQEMNNVLKKIKVPEKDIEMIYNRYEDAYVYFSKKHKNKLFKINLDLFKVSSIPFSFENKDFEAERVIGFDNFKYNIPKAITDEEIRRKDLQELENDKEDVLFKEDELNKRKKFLKDEHQLLRYLYDTEENIMYYY